ncbi:MAG: hypothetical protein WCA11_16785, partial [Terracidiphilus sp.]
MRVLARGAALLFAASLLPSPLSCAQIEDSLPDAPKPAAAAVGVAGSPSPAPLTTPIEESLAGTGLTLPSKVEGLVTPKLEEGNSEQPVSESPPQGAHIDLAPMFRALNRPGAVEGVDGSEPGSQRYNVRMMLWESLAFMASEDAFRFLTDANLRRLTADKPYWHDYIASMQQWNMRRWWDGDDFLVDDIGHPMQGGVASFIEIQNSPRQRDLRLSNSKEYWRSRFLGMMWATVFSTQQKIGPLGEAALGSDGGITYPLNCEFPCTTYVPGVTKYTNNTGWTDFIITPVVGSVWVVLEDFVDLKVSDRLQDRYGNRL